MELDSFDAVSFLLHSCHVNAAVDQFFLRLRLLITVSTAVTSFVSLSQSQNENAGVLARIYSATCESISPQTLLPKDYGILVASVMVDRGNPPILRVWSKKLPFFAPLSKIREFCDQVDDNMDYEERLVTVESDDLAKGGIITGITPLPPRQP